MATKNSATLSTPDRKGFWLAVLFLAVVLGLLFFKSFLPGIAHFANDGPLGAINADYMSPWPNFTGEWMDIYWLGMNAGTLAVDLNSLILLVLGPIGYSKFLQPLSLFFLGICAWAFFRQLKLPAIFCIVAAFAAALNGNFLSNVCWGLGTRGLTLGWIFLALAALASPSTRLKWLKIVLAGLAVGMAVIEGADNGAIFSVYVAAFAVYLTVVEGGFTVPKALEGVGKVALIAVFAFFISFQAVVSLVGTQIQSVAGMEQQQSKAERWGWATQWSLPKAETLRVIIPGLYGYRMDSPDGGAYWGTVGQTPNFQQTQAGIARFSGAGEYAGILVILVALWALAESCRRNSTAFTLKERKLIWFWGIAAFISVLLAWGRFAPFYSLVYALPYFSTIRNPMKFMHPFHMICMILFAYGLLGLWRRYMQAAIARPAGMIDQLKGWWTKASVFEKRWIYVWMGIIGVSIIAFLIYNSGKRDLVQHIENSGFDAGMALSMAKFSISEVGKYIVFLCLSLGSGDVNHERIFRGQRARWASLALGLLVVVDLARANAPWIKFYDYKDKYLTNPIVDILRDKPYEHRVVLPFQQADRRILQELQQMLGQDWVRNYMYLQQVYMVEWIQHHFPYYNVQSLDVSQEPRLPADKLAYLSTIGGNMARLWQLTNTRYVLGTADQFVAVLNQFDGNKNRFRLVTPFVFAPKEGVTSLSTLEQLTATTNAATPGRLPGNYGLFEFTGALPRAKLYGRWQTSTNDQDTLKELANPAFDPEQSVVISNGQSAASASGTNNPPNNAVEITSYSPKTIRLKSSAEMPTILLYNDKYDPGWTVRVDGKPEKLLRANYIMRGVNVPAGNHTIEFYYAPKVSGLYVTLAGIGLGILLCGVLFVASRRPTEENAESTQPVSAQQPK